MGQTKGKTRKRHPKRDLAEIIFTTTDKTAKDIAEILGITEHIIGKWREEDNWDERRQLRNIQPTQLTKRYMEQSQLIIDMANKDQRVLTMGEVDMLSKLSKSITNLTKGTDPQTIMQSLDGFMNYLSLIDLPLSQKIVVYVMNYVSQKLKEKKQN
jgi:hypothetical protein